MFIELKDLCGRLSMDEIMQLVFARWFRNPNEPITRINYSFDLSKISDQQKSSIEIEADLSGGLLSLTNSSKQLVQMMLLKWQEACGNHVEFQYVSNPTAEQNGIIFAACDKFYKAKGITSYSTMSHAAEQIEELKQVVICLPSEITTYLDLRVLAHEIGHALGFEHFHDVPSVKQRLMSTSQGLGCSVMPYVQEIISEKNFCQSDAFCRNKTFSVFPGPLDEKLCTKIYDGSIDFKKIEPLSIRNKYYLSMSYGLLNGGLEQFFSTFLSSIALNGINLVDELPARSISIAITTLLQCYLLENNIPLSSILALTDVLSRLSDYHYASLVHCTRVLTNTSMLCMSLLQIYSDDSIQLKGVYLATMMLSSFCGYQFGDILGSGAGYITSCVFDQTNKLYKWSGQQLSSSINSASNLMNGLRNRFFGGLPVKDSDTKFELQDNLII